ncbi:MAG: hypothetical protein A2381_02100 [Bdellovibrionales bacterium RIFOXYB1_FULL_37_110]|nr:MAG: hypothetical protein A2417_13405 [Bdellovibrionales bacterium RIFOXYC1_FULL_37_79]OFZ59232.1 MAG: hypothetical protein A2381_02100 [Bdellovibrionales bacterium RIFOXYB1_FULL_37_110]OFZ62858.1 MAG: hypothetical protein A2577_11055 [Bdellovibrionales bacterium RIFOXYD1_FULL_36_51]
MKKPAFEKNLFLLGMGAFLVFSVGAILTTIIPPLVDHTFYQSPYPVHTYTASELNGMKIYQANGCVYCHTQQIRNLKEDQVRFGWRLVEAPVSQSWEYVNDRWHFLGTKRTGPDLARVGGKYASSWHWAHFKDPRNMGEKYQTQNNRFQEASLMPNFYFLSDGQIKDLTAYLQTLGRNMNWRKGQSGEYLNDYEN